MGFCVSKFEELCGVWGIIERGNPCSASGWFIGAIRVALAAQNEERISAWHRAVSYDGWIERLPFFRSFHAEFLEKSFPFHLSCVCRWLFWQWCMEKSIRVEPVIFVVFLSEDKAITDQLLSSSQPFMNVFERHNQSINQSLWKSIKISMAV